MLDFCFLMTCVVILDSPLDSEKIVKIRLANLLFSYHISRSMSHFSKPESSMNEVKNVFLNDVIAGLFRTHYPTPGSGSKSLSETMCQVSNYVETFLFFRFFTLEVFLHQ